jgi:hypothetical protein
MRDRGLRHAVIRVRETGAQKFLVRLLRRLSTSLFADRFTE